MKHLNDAIQTAGRTMASYLETLKPRPFFFHFGTKIYYIIKVEGRLTDFVYR